MVQTALNLTDTQRKAAAQTTRQHERALCNQCAHTTRENNRTNLDRANLRALARRHQKYETRRPLTATVLRPRGECTSMWTPSPPPRLAQTQRKLSRTQCMGKCTLAARLASHKRTRGPNASSRTKTKPTRPTHAWPHSIRCKPVVTPPGRNCTCSRPTSSSRNPPAWNMQRPMRQTNPSTRHVSRPAGQQPAQLPAPD